MTKARRFKAMERKARRLQRRTADLQQLTERWSLWRLLVFVGGAAVSGAALVSRGIQWFYPLLLLTMVGFITAVIVHRRVERSLLRHQAWSDWTNEQMARMRLDWQQLPPAAELGGKRHPLELDFDLVGERSLHRLLNTAVTVEGSERLRQYLTVHPNHLAEIEGRQAIVRELVPLALLRGRLVVDGRVAASKEHGWTAARLTQWLGQHVDETPWKKWLWPLAGLALLNILLWLLHQGSVLPPWVATVRWGIFGLYVLLFLLVTRKLGDTFREAATMQAALEQMLVVFRHLEGWNYERQPHLAKLCRPFLDEQQRPSQALRGIGRVVAATGVRGNPILWMVLNAVVPWDVYFAYRLQQEKRALAARLPEWLDSWFELESLCALANLAYLNPHYIFPRFTAGEGICLQAQNLSHPLLLDSGKVGNAFTIHEVGQIFLFTGSNMAGKSTFLRTVGVNLCLAYAGGPVSAAALTTALFRLYSCVRITDSVTDGISYFYAEVKCLKGLLEELEREEERPLLYFIDEIFRGTNNRERLLGSRAYIRALAGKHGVGLIATHDLELARLEEEIEAVTNYHFREEVANGRMVFDYTLRPGPSPTTNALKIMALEGLPVSAEGGEEVAEYANGGHAEGGEEDNHGIACAGAATKEPA